MELKSEQVAALTDEEFKRRPYSWVLIPQSEGGYTGTILEFPGCITEGETIAETMDNLLNAAMSWMDACAQIGRPIPSPLVKTFKVNHDS